MLVKVNKTEIFNTDTAATCKLDEKGQLEIYDNYRIVTDNRSFEESMLIWKQLLEQIVYQHSQYLAALHDPETSRSLTTDFNEQIFDEFAQMEQEFRQVQAEMEREAQEKERQELLDEGINVEDLEF